MHVNNIYDEAGYTEDAGFTSLAVEKTALQFGKYAHARRRPCSGGAGGFNDVGER
jgi:hypothetical protein